MRDINQWAQGRLADFENGSPLLQMSFLRNVSVVLRAFLTENLDFEVSKGLVRDAQQNDQDDTEAP